MVVQDERRAWMDDIAGVAREKITLTDALTRGEREIENGIGFDLQVVLAEADALLRNG